eukprot:3058444-Prymnesium_polylepis.2
MNRQGRSFLSKEVFKLQPPKYVCALCDRREPIWCRIGCLSQSGSNGFMYATHIASTLPAPRFLCCRG